MLLSIGLGLDLVPQEFTEGMLGVHFDTTITVFGHALNSLHLDRAVPIWAKQGNFSLVRTMWLVWVVLFKAAVNVDCPQGISSRFMANIWALFALIFLAIYTANLAAFMITREEYFDFSGVHDSRLSMPQSTKPNFRFGTTPNGATDFILKKNFPEMQSYMRSKNFNQKTVKLGIQAVKQNRLDAFIYDATVLEYLVGQVRTRKTFPI